MFIWFYYTLGSLHVVTKNNAKKISTENVRNNDKIYITILFGANFNAKKEEETDPFP